MVIHTFGHTRTFEVEALLKLFRPAEKFAFSSEEALPDGEYLSAAVYPDGDGLRLVCGVSMGGEIRRAENRIAADLPGNVFDREVSALLYPMLCALTGLRPAWGMLTGIRPVTLLRKYAQRHGSLEGAMEEFRAIWHVTPERTQLAADILAVQQPIFAATPKNSIGLYVSIPFCPTRCRYCSFVSNSTAKTRDMIPRYLDCLEQETALMRDFLAEKHLPVDTVYIGGGTPTVLEADELRRLLAALQTLLPDTLREYTVEAGRPDTITREKLLVLREYGITRISVNPQSFQDAVLQAAGRPHTAQDAVDTYLLARELGFSNINMDFIAGLPCDTAEGFRESIDRAAALNPESITVHCLALKKAADFYQELPMPDAETVSDMIEYAQSRLRGLGYRPYYLYRQKNMAANLENIGYAREGAESPYNILMMDDSQAILGIGAGASTKILGGSRGIERLTECKYPYDYLARFDELMQDKFQKLRMLLQ